MIALLALILTAVPASNAEPVPDQTADALVVAQILGALREGDTERASEDFAQDVTFNGQLGSTLENLVRLSSYSNACQLDRIELVNTRTGTRFPVFVEWQCRYPEPDRTATFWFEGNLISRVRWGERPTVELRARETR